MVLRLALLIGALLILPPQRQDSGFPDSEWTIASPESQGLSTPRLEALKDGLASRKTVALLVVRNDRIVYE
ncbi:MAG: hypothetical protein ACRD15_05445, partial [Vicinamibacterales bacterium]